MKIMQKGFSLLEVLVAVVIFAVGLLAIASLQGSLLGSGADAKTRTVASNLAQDKVEELRAFEQLQTSGTVTDTFEAICPGTEFDRTCEQTETGLENLQDLYGEGASDVSLDTSFTRTTRIEGGCLGPTAECEAKAFPDYWNVSVEVSWADSSGDTNQVVVEDIIGALAPADTVGTVGGLSTQESPKVDYMLSAVTEDFEAVPVLEVDDGENTRYQETWRLKQDTVMEQEVRRIEVIHFTNNPADSDFRSVTRRDEFLAVSCDCSKDDVANDRTPVIWNGVEFLNQILSTEAGITKETGISSSSTALCDRCCRDHHDSSGTYDHDGNEGTQEILTGIDPFRQSGGVFENPHEHFAAGDFSTPSDTDYLESCRFLRKDGFFSVTRDFYLVDVQILKPDEVGAYSTYARDYLAEFVSRVLTSETYPNDIPDMSDFIANNDDGFDDPLSDTSDLIVQGIYVDYMDPVLQDYLACLQNKSGDCDKFPNLEDVDSENWPAVLGATPFQVLDLTDFVTFSDTSELPPDAPDDIQVACKAEARRSNSQLAPAGVAIDPDDQNNLESDRRSIASDSAASCTGL